jgi:YHS domain-containing protein
MRGLIWLVLAGALYWALRELFGRGLPQHGETKEGSEEMVRDPHCGVYVPLSSALKKRVRGETFYFCSRECEEAYEKAGGVSAEDSPSGERDL